MSATLPQWICWLSWVTTGSQPYTWGYAANTVTLLAPVQEQGVIYSVNSQQTSLPLPPLSLHPSFPFYNLIPVSFIGLKLSLPPSFSSFPSLTLRESCAPLKMASPSGWNRMHRIPFASGAVSDTRVNLSRSQNFVVLSKLALARRNSFGWNCTDVTAPVWLLKSVITLPALRSHIWRQHHHDIIMTSSWHHQ